MKLNGSRISTFFDQTLVAFSKSNIVLLPCGSKVFSALIVPESYDSLHVIYKADALHIDPARAQYLVIGSAN